MKPLFSSPARRDGALLLALACTLLGAHAPAHAETLRLCYQQIDVPPWRNLQGTGLNYELLSRVAKRLDLRLELQTLPFKRCLEHLRTNLVHGAFAMSFKPDRIVAGVYPGMAPYATTGTPDVNYRISNDRYVLVRRKGSPIEWDGKAFAHLDGAIGSQPGYSIGGQLRDMGVQVDEGSQTLRELLLKLAAGRLAGAAILGSANAMFMAKNPALAAQLETLPAPLAEKSYYLVLSHAFAAARPDLTLRIWKAIEAVRKSPEYRKIEQEAIASAPLPSLGPPG